MDIYIHIMYIHIIYIYIYILIASGLGGLGILLLLGGPVNKLIHGGLYGLLMPPQSTRNQIIYVYICIKFMGAF